METKLKSLARKQNDIGEFQRQRKVRIQLQPYTQNINYSQTKFFQNCESTLKNIAIDAQNQQKVLQHKRKMKQLKDAQAIEKLDQIDEMLLINILIDYFRSHQMNYSYSMVMRQKNIISEQVVLKGQLASLLNIKLQLQQDSRLNVSILELLLNKIQKLQKIIYHHKQTSQQMAVQCELLTNNNQSNNILLTELKLQQIRNQVEARQKKHYQNQIHLFRSQEMLKLKDDMNKLFETKQAKITQKYEEKLKEMIKNNSSPIVHQKHSEKLQEYLSQINKLKSEIRALKQKNLKLQKSVLEHDCFKNQRIKTKIEHLQAQRKNLQAKKSQFELALRNMSTKVEDLAMQKQKVLSDGKKQTEEFLAKTKIHRQNKDYMIQKTYGTLKGFEQRIQNLSSDNNKLFQENEMLRNQVNGLKRIQQSVRLEESKKRINLSELKIPTRNASIGVSPQQLTGEIRLKESRAQSVESALTYTSDEFSEKLKEKAQQSQKINKLKLQMNLLKNKVKYLVMDFQ